MVVAAVMVRRAGHGGAACSGWQAWGEGVRAGSGTGFGASTPFETLWEVPPSLSSYLLSIGMVVGRHSFSNSRRCPSNPI